MPEQPIIQRWIGLDIHKTYFVAVGVNAEKLTVFGPHKIPNEQLEDWIAKHLLPTDAVVMEMTGSPGAHERPEANLAPVEVSCMFFRARSKPPVG
jgi:hypothetical protein